MAWNISAGAIKNPIPPILLILGLVFAGLTAYAKLPINQLPNIEFPEFVVSVSQPGAAPVEMETQIAQRVEAALTTVQGVRRVNTTISPGNTWRNAGFSPAVTGASLGTSGSFTADAWWSFLPRQ